MVNRNLPNQRIVQPSADPTFRRVTPNRVESLRRSQPNQTRDSADTLNGSASMDGGKAEGSRTG